MEQALDHVVGVMVLNDVTARDLRFANPFDTQQLAIRTRVNGETVQGSSTSSMIFSVAGTVSFLSRTMTLETGGIIATGTPARVGVARKPQRFLQTGDVMEIDIEGVGVLANPIGEPVQPVATISPRFQERPAPPVAAPIPRSTTSGGGHRFGVWKHHNDVESRRHLQRASLTTEVRSSTT
ncbi:fumarylacetoacetate hydrolase family protein [Streptomyces sp. NPDC021056]|uniref:fumarylacetoacetate hydrolase family protein n=1 Tax=unclassified Streptomyces TaxID=2593676 RepID=UPI0033E7128E